MVCLFKLLFSPSSDLSLLDRFCDFESKGSHSGFLCGKLECIPRFWVCDGNVRTRSYIYEVHGLNYFQECYDWEDENPEIVDCGKFVVLQCRKIHTLFVRILENIS